VNPEEFRVGASQNRGMPNLPVRDRADAKLVGVCSALARTWGIDPLVVRAAFVIVALLTNGFALAVYLVLWAILPEPGGVAPLHRLLPATRSWSWGALATVALLATALAAAVTGTGPGAFVILALAWIILRFGFAGRGPGAYTAPPPRPRPAPVTPFERAAEAWQQRLENLEAGRPADWAPEVPAPVARPVLPRRGFRTWLGIVAALGAAWTGLAVAGANGVVITSLAWSASTLLVLGIALVACARPTRRSWGRPALLLPVTVVVALGTIVSIVPTQTPPRPVTAIGAAPVVTGDVTHLAIGEHTIDLSTRAVADETIRYELGVGDLALVVPEEGNVVVRSHVWLGDITLPHGEVGEGFDVQREWHREPNPDAPTLVIDVALGLGEVEVRS